MTTIRQWLGPVWPIAVFALIALISLTVSRLGLGLWQLERVDAVSGWQEMLLQGIRVDVATLCWVWGVPAVLTQLLAGPHAPGRLWMQLIRIWLTLGLWLMLFLEISTPAFVTEYGVRPNRLYVEYLIYPKEVLSMLWAGRKGELLLAVIFSGAVLGGGWWLSGRLVRDLSFPRWYWRPAFALLILAVGFLGARSSLGHRALNPAMVAFADDPLVNALTVNSAYSLFFAIKQMGAEEDASQFYGKMADHQVLDIVREESGRPLGDFTSADLPSQTFNTASYQGKPKNLVILLQESLGAQFVGSLGGLPLTPNIDALSKEGWAFEQLYATGTRSVRGIEAVLTGFTPTPAQAVVKLGKSQTNFFTIADLLKQRGYDTSFIYGGESHFDNMRSFFLGNGFTTIVEQKDFKNPVFEGSWGASDEDLMAKANETFVALHKEGKPFFSLVFSSSNHDPFEFPDNRIALYEQPKQTRNNAAKYADYAVGEFFKKARASDYWKDTLFLVIADHDSRVGGASLVPIPRFHIPGVILGDGIAPRKDPRIVSQIDMAPTLLSLMGISADYPMLGKDLTRMPADWPGRAIMQYDKNFALMRGRDVVIQQPERAPEGFIYEDATETLTPAQQPDTMKDTALGLVLWGSLAYQQGLYRTAQDSRLALN
ncbi:LTA synthase family protein [Aeromonas caviae]|uniref:LTA synthase family protein n=1 Tax=Aeromonas TaxID=642 RepID=UPI00069BADBD|nr:MULTISPECIES: LTA synthase family protein [Aeromonas]MBP4057912.1 LTA synthase family protein [Aeromonas sp. Prich7-2]MCJ7930036.1 LTA synthase family protein [Aeromonas sp. LsrichE-8G]MCY9809264.1 LTA synthase family protein [Aeromonas caviae]MDH0351584.1 LTA synthase family protein [Aeromonas caviae]MDX7822255.1 LTA synthase family protein [Aeromonas caviae]